MTMNPTKPPKVRRFPFAPTERVATLPAEAVACRGCGQAQAATSASVESVIIYRGGTGLSSVGWTVPLARCDDCGARYSRATVLVKLHDLERVYGNVATDKLDAALAALELLGIEGDRSNALTRTRWAVRLLIESLAPVGGAAMWTGYLAAGGPWDDCAPRRWAHVSASVIERASKAYGALLERSLEMPVAVRPPVQAMHACLYCGVGTVEVLPSNASDAWGRLREVDPRALSRRAQHRGGNVVGCLCPKCDSAVAWRALGQKSVQLALVTFLGYEVRPGIRLDGIPNMGAWVSQRPGSEPNETPWSHIDTAMVKRNLERLRGEQVVRRIGEEWPTQAIIVGWVNPREMEYTR